jgi:hypothetical protein
MEELFYSLIAILKYISRGLVVLYYRFYGMEPPTKPEVKPKKVKPKKKKNNRYVERQSALDKEWEETFNRLNKLLNDK